VYAAQKDNAVLNNERHDMRCGLLSNSLTTCLCLITLRITVCRFGATGFKLCDTTLCYVVLYYVNKMVDIISISIFSEVGRTEGTEGIIQ